MSSSSPLISSSSKETQSQSPAWVPWVIGLTVVVIVVGFVLMLVYFFFWRPSSPSPFSASPSSSTNQQQLASSVQQAQQDQQQLRGSTLFFASELGGYAGGYGDPQAGANGNCQQYNLSGIYAYPYQGNSGVDQDGGCVGSTQHPYYITDIARFSAAQPSYNWLGINLSGIQDVNPANCSLNPGGDNQHHVSAIHFPGINFNSIRLLNSIDDLKSCNAVNQQAMFKIMAQANNSFGSTNDTCGDVYNQISNVQLVDQQGQSHFLNLNSSTPQFFTSNDPALVALGAPLYSKLPNNLLLDGYYVVPFCLEAT
jgi:hypothetical protein